MPDRHFSPGHIAAGLRTTESGTSQTPGLGRDAFSRASRVRAVRTQTRPTMSTKKVLNNVNSAGQECGMAQSQISRTLRDAAAVARVTEILSRERFDTRSALGRRVCGEFPFVDARGRPQLSGCLKAHGRPGRTRAGHRATAAEGAGGDGRAAPARRRGPGGGTR